MSPRLDALVRRVPDHPEPGVLFYDVMPLFQDSDAVNECVEGLAGWGVAREVDFVVGIEARGFIIGAAVAQHLGVGFVAARKPGKLPAEAIAEEYALEYGRDRLEMHRDAIGEGDRVLICDDLLATGGTARAAARLVERLGGRVAGVGVIVELSFLPGRRALDPYPVHALLEYDNERVTT